MTAGRGPFGRALRLIAAMLVAVPLARDAFAGSVSATGGAAVVTARPITAFHPSEPTRSRFGDLEFLGGLVLSSADGDFQSLSALLGRDSGRELIAITDEGAWVALRLKTDAAGRPQGVEDVRIARARDAEGRPLASKAERDAESLALRPVPGGGEILVGFEGHHRVLSYRFSGDARGAFAAPGKPVPGLPREIAWLEGNEGLEAIAVAPAGTPLAGSLLLLAEEPRRGQADFPVWIVGGAHAGRLHLARRDRFSVTDAAFLPDGDLLVLQRRVGLRAGLAMRLLRVPAAELRPGRTAEGRVLLDADWGSEIDNMEGLAVDTAPDGSTILTLVSDDNGNWLQRTVLLRFRLVETPR